MLKLNLLLALAALGLGGYAVFSQSPKSDSEADSASARLSSMEASIAAIEEQLRELHSRGFNDTLTASPFTSPAALPPSDSPTLNGTGESKDTFVATNGSASDGSLNEELAKVKEELAKLKESHKRPSPTIFSSSGRRGLFRNSEDLAKQLELDDNQKADIEDILAGAKEELDALLDEQNEDGETMRGVQEELSEAMKKFAANHVHDEPTKVDSSSISNYFRRISDFGSSRLPGRDKTYNQAAKEIRDRAFGRVGDTMAPDQEEKWNKGFKQPLLPSRSGPMSTSSIVISSPSVVWGSDDK